MVKLLQLTPKKFVQFLRRKAHEWGSSGAVQWYGGYPFYLQDKKVTLDNNSIVQACMGWEARNFCEPPGAIREITSSGTEEWEYDNPLAQLFRRPEPEGKMTGRRLFKALLASRRLDGNGYYDIIASRTGLPVELRHIPYWSIEPKPAKGSGILDHYEITMSNGTKEFRDIDQVFHTADGIDDRNPLKGCSALKSAMRLVMTDNAAAASGERLMRNLGVVGLMISPKGEKASISDINRKLLTAELNQRFTGEGQGGAFVSSGEINVDYVGADASKLGFREMHQIPEERITAIFGYGAIVIGLGAGLSRSTFSNFSEAREAATEQTLVPLWSEIADDITVQLGPRFGLKPNQSFAFNLKNVKILQEDEDKRWGRTGTAFQNGGLTRGEYRTAIGYEAKPEDEVYITDIQMGLGGDPAKAAEIGKMFTSLRARSRKSRSDYEALQERMANGFTEGS